MSWKEDFDKVLELASFLQRSNVADIEFSSGHVLEVRLALTKDERVRGLAFLNELDLSGLLFCYDTPTYIPYTMKDTNHDLDIAWFDEDGKLIQSGTYKARSTEHITCPSAFSYVLETPAGTLPAGDIKFKAESVG